MGLVDKVIEELPSACYVAKECMHTARKQLEMNGLQGKYCMLGSPGPDNYCPLQGEVRDGMRIALCLLDDYLRELGEKGRVLKGRDRD